ncbi:MAG: phosphonate ABC transporter, permease protein PhnE, partial [Nitrososphaerota archaeon]
MAKSTIVKWLLLSVVGILFVYAVYRVRIWDISYIVKESYRFFRLLNEMWPPDFSKFDLFVKPLLQTIQMAILGTFLGAAMSIPLVCFGSPIIIKSPLIYGPIRVLMNLIRTIPDLLYAILFVAAMGLGPIAGIPALAFFSCAIISKLTSESADNINKKQIEAVESSGANTLKTISYGVMPQIWPAFIDHTIYVFELNIRVSTVIAYVGAGGIGSVLITALEWFHYSQALAVIITIFGLVVIIDIIGNKIRDATLQGRQLSQGFKIFMAVIISTLVIWSGSSLEF